MEKIVELFVIEMLENETFVKQYSEKKIEIICDTMYDCDNDENRCCLCEKEFKKEHEEENPVAQDLCRSTGNFRGLARNKSNVHRGKSCCSFVPIFSVIFLDIICHINF